MISSSLSLQENLLGQMEPKLGEELWLGNKLGTMLKDDGDMVGKDVGGEDDGDEVGEDVGGEDDGDEVGEDVGREEVGEGVAHIS
jgi:hypothetical protein